jgi:hypothetical protein
VTRELHNMSVPPTSQITLRRAAVAGRRFRVDLASGAAPARLASVQRQLARTGWRAVRAILEAAGEAPEPACAGLACQLEEALVAAGVPASVGVFLEEPVDPALPVLGAAAALAVLARRSGPLYLPSRRLEPSLVRLTSSVLFFPCDPDAASGPGGSAGERTNA